MKILINDQTTKLIRNIDLSKMSTYKPLILQCNVGHYKIVIEDNLSKVCQPQ